MPVEEVDLEDDLRCSPDASLRLLVAATGGPALGLSVADSDWATIAGHSSGNGTWFTTLPQDVSSQAWEQYSDGDIDDLMPLDVPQAVEAATRWAETAALTPDRRALDGVLRNTTFTFADHIVIHDLLDALGLPPINQESEQ